VFISCIYVNKKHKRNKTYNQQQFIYISETSKHFSIQEVWHYQSIIFYKLSVPFNNC